MGRFFTGFFVAVIGSVVANLVILYVFGPLVNNPGMPLHSLSVMPIALFTVVGAVGATVVYAIIRSFTMRPNMPFIWISIIVLLISFIPDYLIIGKTTGMFAGGTVANASTLALMHLVAAIIIVYALTKLWGPKPAVRVAEVPVQM